MSESDPKFDRPSRSARKRAIQDKKPLAERLVALDAKALASIDLPEDLLDAVLMAKKIPAGPARARQLKIVLRQLEDVDSDELTARIDGRHHQPKKV